MKLSLVMIAKNEARCLARCLQSVRGAVDEIIVVDTGSTDDTVKIASENGAKVTRFEWCNDFAAARNFLQRFDCGTFGFFVGISAPELILIALWPRWLGRGD